MKTISELDKGSLSVFKKFDLAASSVPGIRKQDERKDSIEIIDLDVPLEEEYRLGSSAFRTGEPDLGINRDILGAPSANYVSYQILGRLF